MLSGWGGPLCEQLCGEPLALGDALYFEGNRFYRLFDSLQASSYRGRNLRRLPIKSARVCPRERSENRNGTGNYESDDRDESADYRWIELHVSE